MNGELEKVRSRHISRRTSVGEFYLKKIGSKCGRFLLIRIYIESETFCSNYASILIRKNFMNNSKISQNVKNV